MDSVKIIQLEKDKYKAGKPALVILLYSVGILLEIAVLPLWAAGADFFLWNFLHLLAIGLLIGGVIIERRQRLGPKPNQPVGVFSILMIAFYPGMGLLGALLIWTTLLLMRRRARSGIYQDYEEELFAAKPELPKLSPRLNRLEQYRLEVNFEPMVDILKGANERKKISAVEKLSKQLSPENVKLIQLALRDEVPDVRLCAASALLRMESLVTRRIQDAKKRAKEEGSAVAWSGLGNIYRDYAMSGITNDTLAQYYLGLGAHAYLSSLDLNTNQPSVFVSYALCLLGLGDYEKAGATLDRAVRAWPENDEVVFHRNDVYFRLGMYRDLGDQFIKITPQALDGNKKEVYEFWTNAQ